MEKLEKLDKLDKDKRLVRFIDKSASKKNRNTKASTRLDEKAQALVDSIEPGQVVYHKSFGKGVLVAIEDDIASVDFGFSTKKFPYPAGLINGYLTIKD